MRSIFNLFAVVAKRVNRKIYFRYDFFYSQFFLSKKIRVNALIKNGKPKPFVKYIMAPNRPISKEERFLYG